MNRRQFEKRIITNINESLEDGLFKKGKSIDDASNHYYYFNASKGDIRYKQFIRFSKPNYLSYDSNVDVYSQEINNLILSIDPDTQIQRDNYGYLFSELGSYCILRFGLQHYTHPENRDLLKKYRWKRTKINLKYVEKKSLTEGDVPKISKELYATFFRPVIDEIIPRTDTLEKIDAILNNLPELKEPVIKPPVLSVCFPYLQQLTMGLLVANYLDRPDKKELTEKYMELAKTYENDRFGYLNLIVIYIKKMPIPNIGHTNQEDPRSKLYIISSINCQL